MNPLPFASAGVRDRLLVIGQWCALAALFVVPLNKPATNDAIGLCLIFSLCGSATRERWLAAARHPVARGALLWWAVLMLSAVHAWATGGHVRNTGSFIWACWYPLLFGSLLHTASWRRRGLLALGASITLVLLISYAMAAGLVPQRDIAQTLPTMRNTVFKEYTQQGVAVLLLGSMALAAGLASKRWRRWLLIALAALAYANVVMVLESRTAYLTLLPVLAYWIWRLLLRSHHKLRTATVLGTLIVVGATAAWAASPLRTRLVQAVSQGIAHYLHDRTPSPVGIRLELWQQSLPIIASSPWIGHGLDQWAPLYRESIEGLPDFKSYLMGHPHQEMLLILSEQGVLGLAIFLGLLVLLARYIARLDAPWRDIYTCGLLIYLSAGLANCLWADFSHRHLFILFLACIPLVERRHPVPTGARQA